MPRVSRKSKSAKREEIVLCVNPHTLEVTEEIHLQCNQCTAFCRKVNFTELYGGNRSEKCKKCYDRHWMARNDRMCDKDHIAKAVHRANRRSRVRRSTGPSISCEEAHQLWKNCQGKCVNCKVKLTWNFHPRKSQNSNLAVLDRVETSGNRSYSGNAQWSCTICNEEKGGWDLCAQLNDEMKRLRRRLRNMRKTLASNKNQELLYANILFPSSMKDS